jgi:hypothetical protein
LISLFLALLTSTLPPARPETLATIPVGGNRTNEALFVGICPERVVAQSLKKGRFLEVSNNWQAVIGDTFKKIMYSPDQSERIRVSDPLLEGGKYSRK